MGLGMDRFLFLSYLLVHIYSGTRYSGKTIQVIAFLTAALRKSGDMRDAHRRRDRIRALQDEGFSREDLPRADKKWGTCLIICPKTVVGNWEQELERVSIQPPIFRKITIRASPLLPVGLF